MFYRIPDGRRPWIAAVDEHGTGLFQTSTPLLKGRKLFVWGRHSGGRRWQRFLETADYLEVQAGLARTQYEHIPMPAAAVWRWVEAYGLIECPADVVHGEDWDQVCATADQAVERLMPAGALDRAAEASDAWAEEPAGELLQPGSGWGALEQQRRARMHEPPMNLPGAPFPEDSMGPAQHPWIQLLETGRFAA